MKRQKRYLESVSSTRKPGYRIVLWYPDGIGHKASMPTAEWWQTKRQADTVRRRLNREFTLDELEELFGPAIVDMDEKPSRGVSLVEELPTWEWWAIDYQTGAHMCECCAEEQQDSSNEGS